MNPRLRTGLFLIVAGLFVTAGCRTTSSAPAVRNITSVFVDVVNIHHDARSNGDTWDYIWADDDNLYSFVCDGKGYGAGSSMNLNFNCLKGSAWDALSGSLVNPMNEYGKNGAYLADNSTELVERNWSKVPKGANWKVTGADCIDGVIYAFVAENWYGNQNAYGGKTPDPAMRQTVYNHEPHQVRRQGADLDPLHAGQRGASYVDQQTVQHRFLFQIRTERRPHHSRTIRTNMFTPCPTTAIGIPAPPFISAACRARRSAT